VPAGRRAVIIGRRSRGTLAGSINRTVSIPYAAAELMIEAGRAAGQPVFEFGDGARTDMALYAPFVFDPANVPVEHVEAPRERRLWSAARRRAGRARRSVSVARRAPVAVPERAAGSDAALLPHGPVHHLEAPRSGAFTDRLPILMYHRVSEQTGGPYRRWSVTPGELEEQFAFLQQAGFRSLSIEQWGEAGANDRPVKGRPVMLTFDDGYCDFAEIVVPLLQRYGFSAEVFVVSGHVGGTNAWETGRTETDRLMDWATLAQLPRDVVRIGSHTHSHRMLPALSGPDALRELVKSRLILEDRLGRAVDSIAYPYGPADGSVERLSATAGYDYGYTTHHWSAFLGRDLLKLPRLEVRGGQSIDAFAAMVGA
jgi:peptidoglycan/xylan/chitin deacetylase (PgdA/CDA1 family)